MMKYTIYFFLLLIPISSFAQEQVKKSLQISDFAGWKIISNERLSNNGKIISFELNPQQGDGNLIFRNGTRPDTIPRGSNAAFGPENDFSVFHIKPPVTVTRKAKKDKVKKEDMPKDSLGIWVFKHDSVAKFPHLKS